MTDLPPGGMNPRTRFRELRDEPTRHPDPDAIALAVEAGDAADPAVRDHLLVCRRCYALAAELIRTELEWRHADGDRDLPRDLREMGRHIAGAPVPDSGGGRDAHPFAPIGAGRQIAGFPRVAGLRGVAGLPRVAALAAAMAVLLIVLLAVAYVRGDGSGVDGRFRSAAMAGLPEGWAIPGETSPPPGDRMRSGGRTESPALQEGLARLLDRYERADDPPEAVAFWLALGCLADGDHGAARTFAAEAAARDPRSDRLRVVEAAIAYRESRLEDAESILRELVDIEPSCAEGHLALGRVFLAAGRPGDAARAFDAARRLLPAESPLLEDLPAATPDEGS